MQIEPVISHTLELADVDIAKSIDPGDLISDVFMQGTPRVTLAAY